MSFLKPAKPIKLQRSRSLVAKPFVRHTAYGAKIQRDSYGPNWWDIRAEVFARDEGKCQDIGARGGKCGKPGSDVHHVVPLSRGGTTTKSNLITLCKDCHERRHKHMR